MYTMCTTSSRRVNLSQRFSFFLSLFPLFIICHGCTHPLLCSSPLFLSLASSLLYFRNSSLGPSSSSSSSSSNQRAADKTPPPSCSFWMRLLPHFEFSVLLFSFLFFFFLLLCISCHLGWKKTKQKKPTTLKLIWIKEIPRPEWNAHNVLFSLNVANFTR